MTTLKINCKFDIWETEYVCRNYKDKICITYPVRYYADKHNSNSWSLGSKKITIKKQYPIVKKILWFFENNELFNGETQDSLDDLLRI